MRLVRIIARAIDIHIIIHFRDGYEITVPIDPPRVQFADPFLTHLQNGVKIRCFLKIAPIAKDYRCQEKS